MAVSSITALVGLRHYSIQIEAVILAFRRVHKVSLPIACIVLPRAVDVVFRVVEELDPVGDPAHHARNGEQDGVHVGGETHCSVDQSRIEVNIRIKLAGDEILIFQGNLL